MCPLAIDKYYIYLLWELILPFTLNFYCITPLYRMYQSLVILKCYIFMLYPYCTTFIYSIALFVLFVFYAQHLRTLWFGATEINKLWLSRAHLKATRILMWTNAHHLGHVLKDNITITDTNIHIEPMSIRLITLFITDDIVSPNRYLWKANFVTTPSWRQDSWIKCLINSFRQH